MIRSCSVIAFLMFFLMGPEGIPQALAKNQMVVKPTKLGKIDERLSKLESYLNGLNTLHADFTQLNSNGHIKAGAFWLNRSEKKIRLSYQLPAEDVMIIKEGLLSFYDAGTKETNTCDAENTPATFLLRSKIRLRRKEERRGDYVVHSLTNEKGTDGVSYLMLKLGFSGEEEGMSLTLVFLTEPYLKIVGWSVCDASGAVTQVSLSNVQIGMTIESKVFDNIP